MTRALNRGNRGPKIKLQMGCMLIRMMTTNYYIVLRLWSSFELWDIINDDSPGCVCVCLIFVWSSIVRVVVVAEFITLPRLWNQVTEGGERYGKLFICQEYDR